MVGSKPITSQGIFALLSVIKDPEIPVLNIQEIGMLRDVIVTETSCEILLTPTYTGCPAMGIIEQDIKACLHAAGIANVTVRLIYSPAWTTDWMSDSTKEKLRLYGIAAPLHSSCVDSSISGAADVRCPKCHSSQVRLISQFGSTACKSLYGCQDCLEPFDYFKCH